MNADAPMDEFGLINKYFAPLADDGAFGLTDDIALVPQGIISKDVLVEGVHFRSSDPMERVAQKALRANISDIVAKGCDPRHYVLGVVWPSGTAEAEVAVFAHGLGIDQAIYGCTLLGGDTTRAKGDAPMVVSITMIGMPKNEGPILRSGASPNEALVVTGEIGCSGLGLKALLEGEGCSDTLRDAYQLPLPPFGGQGLIAKYATASIDVSDGLIADAGHLANASNVGIQVSLNQVPLSAEGAAYATSDERRIELVTSGDDYQALFTVPEDRLSMLIAEGADQGVQITRIGRTYSGKGVKLLNRSGHPITVPTAGFQHF